MELLRKEAPENIFNLSKLSLGEIFIPCDGIQSPFIVTNITGDYIIKNEFYNMIPLSVDEDRLDITEIKPMTYIMCVDLRDGEMTAFSENTAVRVVKGKYTYYVEEN